MYEVRCASSPTLPTTGRSTRHSEMESACQSRASPRGCGAGTADDIPPPSGSSLAFSGTYKCGSREWTAVMQLDVEEGLRFRGEIQVASGDATGRWSLNGQADNAGTVTLSPAEPVDVPAGYSPVGFTGRLTSRGFEGDTSIQACGDVDLQTIRADDPTDALHESPEE